MVIVSALRPETDPGLTAMRPPMVNLIKLKSEPDAIWEVKTKSVFHYSKPDEDQNQIIFGQEQKGRPAVAKIYSEPTKALVIWELHTANGAEYTDDLRSRVWPAKGAGPDFYIQVRLG